MPRLPIQSSSATTVSMAGRELLAFGGNSYLGLAHHPEVIAALRDAAGSLGVSSTASRETTGNTITHEALEHELAAFFSMAGAILTPEGYTANIALAQTLSTDHSVALVDEKSHRSVTHAAEASGMKVFRYRHRSASHAAELLRENAPRDGKRVALLTDGVFAADGAVAPVAELLDILPPRSTLVIDDCHGFCVLPPAGRGSLAAVGLTDPRVCITTTLAKGLGCYGGCIAGSDELISLVRRSASVYRGTTPVPPPIAHAARAALRIVQNQPELVSRLAANITLARTGLRSLGLSIPTDPTPIIAFTLDPVSEMDRVHSALLDAGILAPVIEYPGGPGPRFFRVTVNAQHTASQVQRLIEEFGVALKGRRLTSVAAVAPAPGVIAGR